MPFPDVLSFELLTKNKICGNVVLEKETKARLTVE
jgi:hypothetical protein